MYLNEEHVLNVLENPDFDIVTYISDRGGRKSSVLQDILISQATKGHPFILIRSKSDTPITEQWLSEYIVNKYSDFTFYNRKLSRNLQAVYFTDTKGKEHCLCYGLYLSLADKYKSNYFEGFEKVKNIVWEECIPNQPIIQSTRYIKQHMLTDLISLMSIYSTVCRNNKAKLILLGNDISMNLINPVTVSFDLLERLEVDTPIIDTVEIDDRQYTFYFLYFSFKNSVEHWLTNKELDVNATITVSSDIRQLDYTLLSQFKQYHIFRLSNFLYISDVTTQNKVDFIQNEKDFFRKYNALHLIEKYKLDLALNILNNCFGVPSYDIEQYFGVNWYFYPKFTPPKYKSKNSVINFYELQYMKYNDILDLPIYQNLLHLKDIIKNNKVIYSNVQIKILLQEVFNIIDIL